MRIFIGIQFEEEIKNILINAQEKTKVFAKKGNFTEENNIHLTLKFIGDVASDQLEDVLLAVKETGMFSKCFSMNLDKMGFFPKGNTSIVWAGIEKNNNLNRLFMNLEKNLSKQGFPKERKALAPHITLGRDVVLTEKYDKIKEQIPFNKEKINVCEIVVMESKRVGNELIYRPLYVQKLK